MYGAIMEKGLIPFFENHIPGYSVEEMTPKEYWFDGEEDGLGPWDWKIECLQSGDIVYGKFLLGGKASFATPKWYRELMNWRRSQEKYQPDEAGRAILNYIAENGSITIREIRHLLGVKKSAADAAITRLMMQCRVVTGDLTRVYHGADLHYNGWQISSFCTPDELYFDDSGFGGGRPGGYGSAVVSGGFGSAAGSTAGSGGFGSVVDSAAASGVSVGPSRSPEESLEALIEHISKISGETDRSRILKILR